jgi:hypothetical protein
LQLTFGLQQILFECNKLFDLRGHPANLIINVFDKVVMSDGSLCGGKHGLFLCEKDILLMFSEIALKKELGKSDMLNLRMREVSIAEDALRNGDVITAKECLIATSACGFSA